MLLPSRGKALIETVQIAIKGYHIHSGPPDGNEQLSNCKVALWLPLSQGGPPAFLISNWRLVQDPRSAEFPDMPRAAIATGCVDAVLTPAEIAEALDTSVDDALVTAKQASGD